MELVSFSGTLKQLSLPCEKNKKILFYFLFEAKAVFFFALFSSCLLLSFNVELNLFRSRISAWATHLCRVSNSWLLESCLFDWRVDFVALKMCYDLNLSKLFPLHSPAKRKAISISFNLLVTSFYIYINVYVMYLLLAALARYYLLLMFNKLSALYIRVVAFVNSLVQSTWKERIFFGLFFTLQFSFLLQCFFLLCK